ncbi:MmpS family transport accessory protein [Streptomyces sp. MAR4 CNX-425]|uniref:MmpS family transport accessory protein n=1 Tax=Streptomyces sp. MAR4 CNX-425 TaxID=3406343 RepID=UPI003B50C89A
MHTATNAETQPENPQPPPVPPRHRRTLTAALAATAAAGLLAYGLTRDGGDPPPAERHVPTAPITYTVEGSGTAHLTYLGSSPKGTATVLPDAELPWTTTVDVPLKKDATLTVVLPADGTHATCALAVDGRHRQRATATGPHGRATCTTALDRPAEPGSQG